jgi:hypothetical protein
MWERQRTYEVTLRLSRVFTVPVENQRFLNTSGRIKTNLIEQKTQLLQRQGAAYCDMLVRMFQKGKLPPLRRAEKRYIVMLLDRQRAKFRRLLLPLSSGRRLMTDSERSDTQVGGTRCLLPVHSRYSNNSTRKLWSVYKSTRRHITE